METKGKGATGKEKGQPSKGAGKKVIKNIKFNTRVYFHDFGQEGANAERQTSRVGKYKSKGRSNSILNIGKPNC